MFGKFGLIGFVWHQVWNSNMVMKYKVNWYQYLSTKCTGLVTLCTWCIGAPTTKISDLFRNMLIVHASKHKELATDIIFNQLPFLIPSRPPIWSYPFTVSKSDKIELSVILWIRTHWDWRGHKYLTVCQHFFVNCRWFLFLTIPFHGKSTNLISQCLSQNGSPADVIWNCVTRAPLLYFVRSWVALSLLCESVSQWGMRDTCPNLHFLQYIKAWMSSTDPVSSITNCYRLIVPYNNPVHSFIIS